MTSSVPPPLQAISAIAGILSAFGVVIALAVLFRDKKRYERDRQDRAEDRCDRLGELQAQALELTDRQAAQARLVICTLSEDYMLGWSCDVTNHSTSILLDLRVREPINSVETGWRLVSADSAHDAASRGRVVAPGGKVRFSWNAQDAMGAQQAQAPPGQFQATTAPIEFTDAAGLRWTRVGTEQPRRQQGVMDA